MGQARARGTFEERRNQAVQRAAEQAREEAERARQARAAEARRLEKEEEEAREIGQEAWDRLMTARRAGRNTRMRSLLVAGLGAMLAASATEAARGIRE